MTTNKEKENSRSKGRPAGSKNITQQAEVVASRCPTCQSSLRSQYTNTQRRDYRGSGAPFVEIIYRRCKCLDCQQWRVDRELVFESQLTVVSDKPTDDSATRAA